MNLRRGERSGNGEQEGGRNFSRPLLKGVHRGRRRKWEEETEWGWRDWGEGESKRGREPGGRRERRRDRGRSRSLEIWGGGGE